MNYKKYYPIVANWLNGHPDITWKEICEMFPISRATFFNYKKIWREKKIVRDRVMKQEPKVRGLTLLRYIYTLLIKAQKEIIVNGGSFNLTDRDRDMLAKMEFYLGLTKRKPKCIKRVQDYGQVKKPRVN